MPAPAHLQLLAEGVEPLRLLPLVAVFRVAAHDEVVQILPSQGIRRQREVLINPEVANPEHLRLGLAIRRSKNIGRFLIPFEVVGGYIPAAHRFTFADLLRTAVMQLGMANVARTRPV